MALWKTFHPRSDSGIADRFELFNIRVRNVDQLAVAIAGLVARHRPELLQYNEIRLRNTVRKALASDVATAALRWPSDAPDLFQEYDRRQSEAEFAQGVPLPMLANSVALLIVDGSLAVKAIALVLSLIAVALMVRGNLLRRELVQFVYEAARAGRVELTHTAEVLAAFAKEISDLELEASEVTGDTAHGMMEPQEIIAAIRTIRQRLSRHDPLTHQDATEEL